MVIRLTRLAGVLASLLLVNGATPGRAEAVLCSPLAAITKALAEGQLHEMPVARAIGTSGVMLIVFAAPSGATWTMIGVKPDHPDLGC